MLVLLKESGRDEFYILRLRDLQTKIARGYGDYLKLKGGLRPKKPQSMHCVVLPKDLEAFRDSWKLLEDCFSLQSRLIGNT